MGTNCRSLGPQLEQLSNKTATSFGQPCKKYLCLLAALVWWVVGVMHEFRLVEEIHVCRNDKSSVLG